MKKHLQFISAIILMVLFTFGAQAQIQVGSGTATGKAIPVEPYYGYTYSQQIYLASEINASGAITQLKFYFAGSSLSNSNDWTIYIGHTSKTSFSSTTDWVPVSSLTQVYSATFTNPGAAGWITFDITDWAYNGTDNIVVAVDENASSYDGGSDDFNCSSVTGNRSIYYRNDNTNPDPASPPTATGTQAYIPNIIFDGISQACPVPSAQIETNLTSTSVDLGWTENGSATIWNIEWGPSGFTQGSGTMITGTNTNPYSLSGLTANSNYDWYVQADCGSGSTSSWAGPRSFFTGYCTPAPTSVDGTGITNVTFGTGTNTVNNTTGDEAGHYGDYSAQIGDGQRTTTVSVDITYQTGYTYVTKIWVDYNDDLDFDDAGEEVYSGTSTSSNPTTLNASFTIPSSATLGNHRMRIGGADTGPPTPCYTGSYAAYEDYTLNILAAPACPPPSAQTEANITSTSVDLGWTENGTATTWDIEYGPSGFTQGSGTTVSVTANPYTLSGLSATTSYDWYVRADCGGSTSSWVGPSTFTTACTAQSTPYTEDFENGGNFPNCWTQSSSDDFDWTAHSGSTLSSNTGPSSAHGGTYYIYTESSSPVGNSDQAVIYSPTIDLSGLTTPQLNLWYHMYGSGMDPDGSIDVSISTNGGSSYTSIWSKVGNQGNQWNNAIVSLSSYSGNVIFRITGTVSSSGTSYENDFAIDDFKVEETPACPQPSAQTEANIATTSVDLGWTENGTATTWDIEYGPTGFSQGSGTTVSVTSNPYSLSGLSSGTTYDWYVRADCGGNTSSWTGPHSFSTTPVAPGCATSPSPADAATGVAVGTVSLSWTAPVDDATHDAATSYDVYFGTTSGALTLEGNTSSLTYNVSAPMDLTTYYWKIIPKNSAGSATGCSEWSFTTAVTQSATTQTAPWSEDFSTHSAGTGTTTNGWLTNPTSGFAWTISTNGGTTSSSTGPSADNTGDSHFIFTEASSGSTGSVAVLYSPKLDLSALTSPELTFYYHMYGATMGDLHIDVYNGSTYTNDVATALSGQQQSAQGDAWLKYTVNLSSYSGTIHIRFRGVRGSSYTGDMSIDDFSIHERPACPQPTAQTETNIATTSVDLSWTENGSATTWDIEYGPTGFSQGSGTTVSVTSNPYSLSGLTAYTTYDWYVRADCGAGSASSWTGPHSFTTTKISSTTLAGKTSKCSPQFVRPNAGTPPPSQSSNTVFYDKFSITVPVTGTYDILANWSYDGYLHIYENSFDPANPMSNVIGGEDDNDNGGGSGQSGSKIEGLTLSAGTTYIIVGSAYGSTYGTQEYWLEGASAATMPASTDYYGYPYRTYTVATTDGTSRTSDYECDDANDWTTYYDDNGTATDYSDDNLLFAIKKNGNNLGTTTVTVDGAAGASFIAPSTTFSKYVNSFQGWYVFNRYWNVSAATQPTSDVDIRFYYKDADFSDLNTALGNAGRSTIANREDMSALKINDLSSSGYDPDPANGHNNIPKATTYDADGAWIYNPPASSSTVTNAKWTAGDYNSDHYFQYTVKHFSGGGGGAAGNTYDGTLPIELLSFNAFAKGDINQIVWKTASEFNVDKFIVERMNPVTKKIEEIGSVKAVGNSNVIQSYSFDDMNPLEEAYYRIRNVDYDGATESFDWVYVKRSAKEFKLVNLYPNPAHNTAHIELVNPTDNSVHIELRDMVGKVILSNKYETKDGLQSIDLDLSSISAGTYYISIDNTKDRIIKMIIIR